MESTLKFQRGDIYFIRLGSGTGSEQSGTRPAVILQNDVGNAYSPTLIVAALTSKTDKKVTQATHCQVEEDGLKPSIVQAEQIFTIDKSRVLKFVGHLSPENMRRVDDAVKISLALNPMGSIQKLKPIIRSQAAYAPPEVVDGKPPIYPYTPIKSSFEDAGSVEDMMRCSKLPCHNLTLSVSEPDNAAALRKRGPTPNPAKIVYGKLEVVCYKISATNSSIKRFTCSGLSVLELCPAPSIHIKGIFVLRCHALLYRIYEPA